MSTARTSLPIIDLSWDIDDEEPTTVRYPVRPSMIAKKSEDASKDWLRSGIEPEPFPDVKA